MSRLKIFGASLAVAVSLWLAFAPGTPRADDCCYPASPFREGEGLADTPATCGDIGHWAERAPTTNARITLSIKGRLSKVEANSALVYLTMCASGQLQVTCVTYQTNGMKAGDAVFFAGGYERSTSGHVVLDPCLASAE